MFAAALLACLLQDEPQDDYRPPGYVYARMPSPWGPADGWEIGEFRIRPRGAFLGAGFFSGEDLDVDVPRAINIRSDGVNYPLYTHFEYRRMDLDAEGVSVMIDLDGLRLNILAFFGDMEGRGTLLVDDGLGPEQRTDVDVDGDAHGFRISAYWPGIRYRDRTLDVSVGPALGVGWIHTEIDEVPGAPLDLADTTDQLIVTAGLRASFRLMLGRWAFQAEAEYAAMGGDSVGGVLEATLGVGVSF